MKYLIVLLVVLTTTLSAFSQDTTLQKHIRKAFESIQQNDGESYKSLWPNSTVFCKIILEKPEDIPNQAQKIYCESRYYRMLAKVLEEFTEERYRYPDVSWDDLYIEKIYLDTTYRLTHDTAQEKSGYLWLKSKKDNTVDLIYPFTDIIHYYGQWYGCMFKDLKNFDGSFENAIQDIEKQNNIDTLAYEATEAAAASAADTAAAVMPVMEQIKFTATVNGKKISLEWVVTGWEDDPYYNQSKYEYLGAIPEYFEQILPLSNHYFLLVEQGGKNYFRLQKKGGMLSGIWFSAATGKEYPVVFNKIK